MSIEIEKLTRKDVEQFEFLSETPARGMAYYSNEHDISVIVYSDYFKVYFDRVSNTGKTPCCFSKSRHVKINQ